MKLTYHTEQGYLEVIRVIAQYGNVISVDDERRMLALELGGIAYRLYIHQEGDYPNTRPEVLLTSFTGAIAGLGNQDIPVLIADGEYLTVPLETAQMVIAQYRRVGPCASCRAERHDVCLAQSRQGVCRCACADEWAAVHVARKAEQIMTVPGAEPMRQVLLPAAAEPQVVRSPLPPAPNPVISVAGANPQHRVPEQPKQS